MLMSLPRVERLNTADSIAHSNACNIPLMTQFKVVEARACEPGVWLDTWAAEYDSLAGYDEKEYDELIDLAGQNAFPAKYFERMGRWKDSAKSDRRWRPNVASVAYIIWLQAETEQPPCPRAEQTVHFLENWAGRMYEDVFPTRRVKKRFGLSRATTLLHFLSAGRFPIYDSNVIEGIRRLYGINPSYTAEYYWITFCPQFKELAGECKTNDRRKLDKALFSYGATKLLA